jgi:peptidoglycan/LPS O-acetylase OafA/YrhL
VPEPRIRDRYAHIDAVRAFAVLLVVVQHSGLTFIPGPSGVTLFFAISGFIITHILIREREVRGGFDIGGFYLKRGLKLGPPFLVAIVLPTIIAGALLGTFKVSWDVFASQILFSYNWVQVALGAEPEGVLPGSQIVWSLAVEEQFYIVFAIVWLIAARTRHWFRVTLVISIVAILSSTAWRIVLVHSSASDFRIARATDTRLDSIAWGVLAALALYAWRTGKLTWLSLLGRPVFLVVSGVLFVAGFAPVGPWYELTMRYTLHSLAAIVFILFGMISTGRVSTMVNRGSNWRPVKIIGLASYSIYLVHYVLGDAVRPFLAILPSAAAVLAFIVLGIGAGIALYYVAEVPAHRLKRHLGY